MRRIIFALAIAALITLGCSVFGGSNRLSTGSGTGTSTGTDTGTIYWEKEPGGFDYTRGYRDFMKEHYKAAVENLDVAEKKVYAYSELKHLDPKNSKYLGKILILRGNCYFELHDFEKALADFRKHVEIYPRDVRGHYNVGRTLAKMGKYDEAMKSACRARELDPDYPKARHLYDWLKHKILKQRRKIKPKE